MANQARKEGLSMIINNYQHYPPTIRGMQEWKKKKKKKNGGLI
jgi:hypothetical protein